MEITKVNHGYKVRGLGFGNPDKYDYDLKQWTHYITICEPVCELDTNNCDHMDRRKLFRLVPWAKLVYKDRKPYMDEDPSGRRVQRGWIDYEIWDLRSLFGMTDKPLKEFVSEYQYSLIEEYKQGKKH